MIRKLEQGPCVQYMRDDGGWRVGHVYEVVTQDGASAALVRECHTGELLVLSIGLVFPYPQSPIPEPGVEAVQNDEVWHAPDERPRHINDVVGDFGGRLVRAWYCPVLRKWHWNAPTIVAPTPDRWRELKEGER